MMKKQSRLKKIPKFKNEAKEAKFWSKNDSTEFVDWSKGERVCFPNLHPSSKHISIRLPESLLAHVKAMANKKDVPYQSLIKTYIADKVKEDLGEYTVKKTVHRA